MKPDWSKAPEWAKYWALDRNGKGWFYENEPTHDSEAWMCDGKYTRDIVYFDWEKSLLERPK